MLSKEVVRRNRRRQLLVVAASWLNLCVFFASIWLAGVILLVSLPGLLISGAFELDLPALVVSSLVLGPLVASAVLLCNVLMFADGALEKLGARPPTADEHRRLSNLLAELSLATGTRPVLGAVLDDEAPNALAVGLHSVRMTIVVTSALLRVATRDELEAVLAVELCAIRRLETGMHSTVLACTAGPLELMVEDRGGKQVPSILAVVCAPSRFIARLLRSYALRTQDFATDDMAVAVTRNPDGLRRVLEKLRADGRSVSGPHAEKLASLWFEPLPEV